MLLPELFEICAAFQQVGIRYWLFGGNAVELVTGRDIRPHDDVDLFVALAHAGRAVGVLEALGFSHHAGSFTRGDVFYARDGVLVDLVPVDDAADPPACTGELAGMRLPGGFLDSFRIDHPAGAVITLSPEMHRRMKEIVPRHFGFAEMREKDRLDLLHLDAVASPDGLSPAADTPAAVTPADEPAVPEGAGRAGGAGGSRA